MIHSFHYWFEHNVCDSFIKLELQPLELEKKSLSKVNSHFHSIHKYV